MSVREVTYYQIVCDELDCGRSTGDLGGDYSAWSDAGTALDEWVNSDGWHDDDGRSFCPEHAPKCPGCGLPTQPDPTESSHKEDCPTHQHEWGKPTNYTAGRIYRECQTCDAMQWLDAPAEEVLS